MSDSQSNLITGVYRVIRDRSEKHGEHFLNTFKSTARKEADLVDDLNRYFNMELSLLPTDTLEARECLLSDISGNRWLSYFTSHVVTLLVRFQRV